MILQVFLKTIMIKVFVISLGKFFCIDLTKTVLNTVRTNLGKSENSVKTDKVF